MSLARRLCAVHGVLILRAAARIALGSILVLRLAHAAEPLVGLADPAALRATVYGAPPQDLAPLPAHVPLREMNLRMPWARPLPAVLWFDRRLRVWFSAQRDPAPLAIVIAGTGSDGNTAKLATLRGALYGAGYHVLTMPSPTFPGFIASASSTGVVGDLPQDSADLYATLQEVLRHLPRRTRVTDIDVLGYSLGGAHAAYVKALDSRDHRIGIRRAVLINPPVSLFDSIGRLDRLFNLSIGSGDAAIEGLYRTLYLRLANYYRASDRVRIEDTDLFQAAGAVLKTDADFAATIALSFRIALMNVFYAGDLYAGTGVVLDPHRPASPGDSTEDIARALRDKPFARYLDDVLLPYAQKHRQGVTHASLLAASRLDSLETELRANQDYYVQTNADDLILSRAELDWLRRTFRGRIAVYDHGGHLGNLGERQQIDDLLAMLGGVWNAGAGARESGVPAGPQPGNEAPSPQAAAAAPDANQTQGAAIPAPLDYPGTTAAPDIGARSPVTEDKGPPLTLDEVPSIRTWDPWERANRFTYRFNARFDEALFLPVANGYRHAPQVMRAGVHNFFANLSEVVSFANHTAQLRPVASLRTLGRFAINSTIGIGGLFDVATRIHLPPARTGFSDTLARWGVHPGPYFVIPILGPSTLRDGVGFAADFGLSWIVNTADLYRGRTSWMLTPINAVDTRARTDFRYYATGSPFEYDTVRFLYVRKELIEDEGLRLWKRRGRPDASAPAGQ